MRTLIHLSDVHFGRTDPDAVESLVESIKQQKPDLVAISGDLTQRARVHEFEQARAFLDRLPQPQIVVPGNHDVPLHNLYDRFRHSLRNYRQFIAQELTPFYNDDEISVLGINTARSLTIKGGRVNTGQIAAIESHFRDVPASKVKVLVSHHPFDLQIDMPARLLVGRARSAMTRFALCGVDLLLAGHFHLSQCGQTALRYAIAGHSAVFVQAGTACSTRGRGEANSYNRIHIEQDCLHVDTLEMSSTGEFTPRSRQSFDRTDRGWATQSNAALAI